MNHHRCYHGDHRYQRYAIGQRPLRRIPEFDVDSVFSGGHVERHQAVRIGGPDFDGATVDLCVPARKGEG